MADPVAAAAPAPVSRRQRRHEATAEEIRQVARELMAREGSSSLNLRAVAREMGITPSALYRYYPSRDAILTALIVEAYDQVGEAVEQAIAAAPADHTATRILAGAHAFRHWAVGHPHEFGLIYGTPVPGYEAPATESITAAMRTGLALFGELVRAVEQGLLTPPDDATVPADLLPILRRLALDPSGQLPVSAVALALQCWMVLLGSLSAEVFGHKPEALDGGEAGRRFFDYTMRQTLIAMGVDRAAVDAGVTPPA